MISLARFILKGHSQAALVAAVMAILGLLLPPFVWLSASTVALITLVGGYRQGTLVTVIAAIGLGLLAFLIQPVPEFAVYLVVFFILLLWLPMVMIAAVLRQTVSIVFSLQLIAAVCLAGIVIQYQFFPEFSENWYTLLNNMADDFVAQSNGQLDRAQLQDYVDRISEPGSIAANYMISILLSLYIARWWQAVIYNPGGFGKEFRTIQLGKTTALITLALVAAAILAESDMFKAMLLVLLALYLQQGLAIMHAVFSGKQLNAVWLFPAYLVIIFVPYVMGLLVLAGLADTWIDFRRRLLA
jgi:hypothetical protein